MRRNFAEISSETKVRNLFVEIREIRSHFFFAQYCILLTLLPSGDFAFEAGFDKVDCRKCIFILLLLANEEERKESQKTLEKSLYSFGNIVLIKCRVLLL